MMKFILSLIFLSLLPLMTCEKKFNISDFQEARDNGQLVNEGFNRCIRFVEGWSSKADPASGLIPRNLRESADYWNAWDAAADNYPFMVLTASIVMPDFFATTALKMLESEKRLTPRIGKLPDTYSFSKKGFLTETPDTTRIIFGSAEYMKDGLIPLTEWLGKSPWSDRMLEILDDLPILARFVKHDEWPSIGMVQKVEINGDILQVLSRMYWFTGKKEYFDRAAEIADYYLNEANLPTLTLERLRIRDHGCEIISGLCEAYLAASYAAPEKREQWKPFIHRMLDRILEAGRNGDGLFYNEINPVTGAVTSKGIADNFGYTFNAYHFVGNLDNRPDYIEAIKKGLGSLNANYRNFNWENGGMDGYADAIEGALNLYNRMPSEEVKAWLDSEIRVMWNYQKEDGIIEGWHGDGNFARTTIMYCLWKTQGMLPDRWEKGLKLGAEQDGEIIRIAISSREGYNGKIKFGTPLYKDKMNLPVDYARINQFQQWFVPDPGKKYQIAFYPQGKKKTMKGEKLTEGLQVSVVPGEELFITVRPL